MDIEQAKTAIKDAMQRFEGEGWDNSDLEEVIKFIDQHCTQPAKKVTVQEALLAAHKHAARYT